jgi:predicted molibdopterin-dependent oxidoreductase YjgC
MFTSVFPPKTKVSLFFENEPIEAGEGMTVAAAVLLAGKTATRLTGVGHAERGAYCGMGLCYDCLMEIDGTPNQQACLTPVREGMRISRQQGDPDYTARGTGSCAAEPHPTGGSCPCNGILSS